jgi:hypothetical protein
VDGKTLRGKVVNTRGFGSVPRDPTGSWKRANTAGPPDTPLPVRSVLLMVCTQASRQKKHNVVSSSL